MQEELTYEQAVDRLEKITQEMEEGRVGIDRLAECLREAQQLLAYCRDKLANAEKDCNSLLNVEEKD